MAGGITRILGELKKLGITTISRSTVVNILKEAGLDPGPKRGKGTWDELVKRHAATLWACDFLSVKSQTLAGVVDLYILFFIRVGTCRVVVSTPTTNPYEKWVAQQARNALIAMAEWGLLVSYLLIDHDTKFTNSFDAVFEAEGAEVKRVGPRAPNMNAYAERFVQSIKSECLGRFIVCGEKHLRHLISEYIAHYHDERPHRFLASPCPLAEPKPAAAPPATGSPPGRFRLRPTKRICSLPGRRPRG